MAGPAGKLPKIFWPATHPNGRRPRSTGVKGDPGTGCGRGIRAGQAQTRPCPGRTPASPGRLSPVPEARPGGSRRPVTERIVMPSQDAKRAGLSRRNLLQGAATAGAAGLAVTAMGAAAPALAATGTDTGSPSAADHGHHADTGPIMVH